MTSAAKDLFKELEEERRALRLNVVLTVLTFLGLLIGFIAQVSEGPGWLVLLAYLVAYLAGGVPAGLEALGSLRRGKLDIDLLMVLAALAAAAVGEARDGAILLFLFSLAETLEDYAMGNTKRAVASLMKLRPETANLRLEGGETRQVGVETLQIGDVVIVKPGERVPIDGEVLSGQSAIDQAPITGESVPVDKTVGDAVFAGTVNGHGALQVAVTKRSSDSTLARMVTLVTEAQEQRSPSERFSEWFGQRYTVFVLLGSVLALGIFFLVGMERSLAFYKAATLLVVASPCAIVISVPAAVLSALAAAARRGVLFKGGAALEDFGNIHMMAFDKTGTLTEGKMEVTDVVGLKLNEADLLALAASLEAQSEHPLAKSILARAEERGRPLKNVSETQAVPGKGLTATLDGQAYWAGNRKLAAERGVQLDAETEATLERLEQGGKTTIMVGSDVVLGVIAIADTVRPSARAMLSDLKRAGLGRVAMLTGDHHAVAKAVADQLGIDPDQVHADLLPEDKVTRVKALSEGGAVAFVGDGVNDAAALATAQVGVAMGTAGSDVALEAADVALLSDDLQKLPEAYALAQRANRIIRQNLTFALGIMVIMVLLTLFWRLPLPLGVLGHEGGTLLVVANGLRLLLGSSKDARAKTLPQAQQLSEAPS